LPAAPSRSDPVGLTVTISASPPPVVDEAEHGSFGSFFAIASSMRDCSCLTGRRFFCATASVAPGSGPAGWRKTNPRFTGANIQRNLRIADDVGAVAAEVGATPAQVALAWLLAQGGDIAPIPGIKRVSRVEENVAADRIQLTSEQIDKLTNLTPPAGDHHNEAQMRMIDR
jgi:hypothetical protein